MAVRDPQDHLNQRADFDIANWACATPMNLNLVGDLDPTRSVRRNGRRYSGQPTQAIRTSTALGIDSRSSTGTPSMRSPDALGAK